MRALRVLPVLYSRNIFPWLRILQEMSMLATTISIESGASRETDSSPWWLAPDILRRLAMVGRLSKLRYLAPTLSLRMYSEMYI